MRSYISQFISQVSPKVLFKEKPTIHFYPETQTCKRHHRDKLLVLKTRDKTAATLDIGAFRACETVLHCPQCNQQYSSSELAKLVPQKCQFGYDVLVYVGRSLFIKCQSDQNIILELAEKNIEISEREIAFLGKKFITYLAIAHGESRVQIKKTLKRRGGYILHLDGTCDGDSPHLFCGIDGLSKIVLENIKIPSEKAEVLIPFLKKIRKLYGNPLALVHDMGLGILKAVDEIFPGIPDYICHFHWLRDVGRDLLEENYSKLRNRITKMKTRTLLRRRLKDLEKNICDDRETLVHDLETSLTNGRIISSVQKELPTVVVYALIQWALNAKQETHGYGFPFDYCHLIFYRRLKIVYETLDQIMDIRLSDDRKDNRPYYMARLIIKDAVFDPTLAKTAEVLEKKYKVFERLREIFRIASAEDKEGLNDEGKEVNMSSIETELKNFRECLVSDEFPLKTSDYQDMLKQIDKYWTRLFAKPIQIITSDGPSVVLPQRTNNMMERFFRDLGRDHKKKTGTSSLNKRLKAMMADTPLVKNLDNEEYMQMLLAGHQTLEDRFADIDASLVREAMKKNKQENQEMISPAMKKIIRKPNLPQKVAEMFGSYQTTDKSNRYLRS